MTKRQSADSPKSDVRQPKLLDRAKKAAMNAYAPYSNFSVGAAVETMSGEIYVGANMENISYGLTMCAEVGAIQAAATAGALGKIRRIAIAGGSPNATQERARYVPPCGRCRQLIAESAMLSGHDIEVIYSNLTSPRSRKTTISKLLPGSFGKHNLKQK